MKYPQYLLRHGLALVASVALATSGWAASQERVYVNFKPGQKAVAKGLIEKAKGTVHYEFDSLNAIATTLPSAAVAALGNNPSIAFIEEDPPRFLFSHQEEIPYGIDLVQASAVWDPDNNGIDAGAHTGAGIKVGVIDSGVFTGHEDFAGVNITGYNGNLPWAVDGSGHGTHVVGTIAAAGYNGKGVVGVSPRDAQIFMVRVFGDGGAWAYSSSLLDAAQRCQAASCMIISMSLGGGRASRTEESGLNAIYNNGNGILIIAAAGNAGNTTVSYPAGYASVVSVAAVDRAKVVATFSQKNADVELSGPGVGVLSTVPYADVNTATVGTLTVDGGSIEFAARGTATGLLVDGGFGGTVGDWAGRVVLIQRDGILTFNQKVQNAQSGGAVAVIIYNNEPGNFSSPLTLGTGNSSGIPAISVSGTDGTALLAHLNESTVVTSTFTSNASGYAYYDGTSMATPHVSGVAALVWSAKPLATAGQIRTTLQTTALDLGTAGRDSSYGFGLVQAKSAITALVVVDTTPPVITGVSASVVNAKRGTFKIVWTTNEPADSKVTFEGGSTYTASALVTTHSMTFSGTKGATYTYTVSSKDATGNIATAGPFTFVNQ